MPQRDHDEQFEAPDLAAPAGDPDDLDRDDSDDLEVGYSPPDRPYLAEEDEVTARGMREGDTLDERLRRETAEEAVTIDDPGAVPEPEPSMPGSPALADPALDAALGDPEAVRAEEDAAQDVRADGEVFDPGLPGPPPDTVGVREPDGPDGEVPHGGDLSGRGPDPARPRDPFDTDPARRAFPDGDTSTGGAEAIDAARGSRGAAAGASGRDDAGPDAWR